MMSTFSDAFEEGELFISRTYLTVWGLATALTDLCFTLGIMIYIFNKIKFTLTLIASILGPISKSITPSERCGEDAYI